MALYISYDALLLKNLNIFTINFVLQDGSSSSKIFLRPEDITTVIVRPDNILVECLASHPELGEDFITYAHTVEIMCKFFKILIFFKV